jgi:hypothetical protein
VQFCPHIADAQVWQVNEGSAALKAFYTALLLQNPFPRDLTKQFAAMSNRFGGLIIIGNDPRSGDSGARSVCLVDDAAAVMSSFVAQVPIIWMLYLEEVLVRMECDN